MKKGILRNFTKFTEKHLFQNLFFDKVTGFRPAPLRKKRLWHTCFPLNFAKLLRTPFLQNTYGRKETPNFKRYSYPTLPYDFFQKEMRLKEGLQ